MVHLRPSLLCEERAGKPARERKKTKIPLALDYDINENFVWIAEEEKDDNIWLIC